MHYLLGSPYSIVMQYTGSPYSIVMQYTGSLYSIVMQYTGSLYSIVMQYTGSPYSIVMQYTGSLYSIVMQYTGSLYSIVMQYMGSLYCFFSDSVQLTGAMPQALDSVFNFDFHSRDKSDSWKGTRSAKGMQFSQQNYLPVFFYHCYMHAYHCPHGWQQSMCHLYWYKCVLLELPTLEGIVCDVSWTARAPTLTLHHRTKCMTLGSQESQEREKYIHRMNNIKSEATIGCKTVEILCKILESSWWTSH